MAFESCAEQRNFLFLESYKGERSSFTLLFRIIEPGEGMERDGQSVVEHVTGTYKLYFLQEFGSELPRSRQFGNFCCTLIGKICAVIAKTAHLPIYPLRYGLKKYF